MKPNLVTRKLRSVLVVRQNRQAPTDAEWADAVQLLRELVRLHGREARAFVYTEGGAPNAEQRGLLQEELASAAVRTAVVSDSVGARVTSSAVALGNRNHRSFGVGEVTDAYAHLSLSPAEVRSLEDALMAMAWLLE
jgi:hypothetical protein